MGECLSEGGAQFGTDSFIFQTLCDWFRLLCFLRIKLDN